MESKTKTSLKIGIIVTSIVLIVTAVFFLLHQLQLTTRTNMIAGESDVEKKASETKPESSTDFGVSDKRMTVFKWKSINGDTIEANLIGDIENEKSAIGLDIKFYDFNHPEATASNAQKAEYKGMQVEYIASSGPNMEINEIIDNIIKSGSFIEYERQRKQLKRHDDEFNFYLCLVAPAEHRKQLLEMAEKMKIEQKFYDGQAEFEEGDLYHRGVLNIVVEELDGRREDVRVAYAFSSYFEMERKYERLRSAFWNNNGIMNCAQFKKLFANTQKIDGVEYDPFYINWVYRGAKNSSHVSEILKAIQSEGFASFIDNMSGEEKAFLGPGDIYFFVPNNEQSNRNIKLFNDKYIGIEDELKKLDLKKDTSVKQIHNYVYERRYSALSSTDSKYIVRVLEIKNILKSELIGLHIEIAFEDRISDLDRAGAEILSDPRKFIQYTFLKIKSMYKDLLIYSSRQTDSGTIGSIIKNIEEKGLENEFNEQYKSFENDRKSLSFMNFFKQFPSFEVLIIGRQADIKQLLNTLVKK